MLIGIAKAAAKTPSAAAALEPGEAAKFLERIEKLYADMSTSLRFKPEPPAAVVAAPPAATSPAEREADFRGVICPLNYVKTKMVLAAMKSGSVLSVLLDEPGSRNVPASVEKDGHSVLSIDRQEQHWRVRIRKG